MGEVMLVRDLKTGEKLIAKLVRCINIISLLVS